ncbi:MAG: tetratricopeptide repeat protein, partial [Nostocaceae cyanobacterium]|nr:tetratricopeptide repeat protein [Nostocaceae cyanobacterium]
GKAASLHQLAGIYAQQGDVTKAIALYSESLQLDETIGNVQGKAATLHELAGIYAQQGDVTRAIAFYSESLQLTETIGNVRGKAASLHQLAGIYAQQGDVTKAIALYSESLQLKETIGDVQGKAATLANMAALAFKQGDINRALELLKQSAQTLALAKAYIDLLTVLNNLSVADETNGLVYLAQATWLSLRIYAPIVKTINLIRALFNTVPQGNELEALLASTALYFCQVRGEGHPELESLQERSWEMISFAADAQGITTPEAFHTWFTQQQLNEPEYFLPRLAQHLEAIVGDGWLFERDSFPVSGWEKIQQ